MSQQVQVRILLCTLWYCHILPLVRIFPIKSRGMKRGEEELKKKKITSKILKYSRELNSPQKTIPFYLKRMSRNLHEVLQLSYYFGNYEKIEAPWRLGSCIHIYSQVLDYPHTPPHKAIKQARNSHHTLLNAKRFALEVPYFST